MNKPTDSINCGKVPKKPRVLLEDSSAMYSYIGIRLKSFLWVHSHSGTSLFGAENLILSFYIIIQVSFREFVC